MSDVVLTALQRSILLETLCAFAPPIHRVDVYGSRACGMSRPGSDIDLVFVGPLDWGKLARIRSALEESYLSIFADVAAYDLMEVGSFRDQVIKTAVTLFDRDELLAARDSASRAA